MLPRSSGHNACGHHNFLIVSFAVFNVVARSVLISTANTKQKSHSERCSFFALSARIQTQTLPQGELERFLFPARLTIESREDRWKEACAISIIRSHINRVLPCEMAVPFTLSHEVVTKLNMDRRTQSTQSGGPPRVTREGKTRNDKNG